MLIRFCIFVCECIGHIYMIVRKHKFLSVLSPKNVFLEYLSYVYAVSLVTQSLVIPVKTKTQNLVFLYYIYRPILEKVRESLQQLF